jgi:hypothetical protein
MAEADFTQSTIPQPKYHDEDTIDRLNRKSSQLHALIRTTVGLGFQGFDSWNDTIKENFLWACADLAEEVEETSRKLEIAIKKQ